MITDEYKSFLDKLFTKINELRIDVSGLELDHLGYQASSNEVYDQLKPEFLKFGEQVSENIVGGRRVGIFQLKTPLKYEIYTISAIELIAPKEDQICQTNLEHAEFVLKENFESFMKKYPNLSWDISAINQDTFPMIKLKLDTDLQVKFHSTPVLEIIKNQKIYV